MTTFKIRFTKPVTFKDRDGNVRKEYQIGDTEDAYGETRHPVGNGTHFITGWGCIYNFEAERVEPTHDL